MGPHAAEALRSSTLSTAGFRGTLAGDATGVM
jgi:hypothetical protein